MKITLIELNLQYSRATYQLVLTSISDFFFSSEVVTMWQTDSTVHKLKPRSFHKSTHLQANLADFYLWYKPCLTHIVKRMIIIEDRLLSDILGKHYCYRNMLSGVQYKVYI